MPNVVIHHYFNDLMELSAVAERVSVKNADISAQTGYTRA